MYLDTRKYKVEFLNRYKTAMAANLIAENMHASVDEEGNCHMLLDSIVGHWKNDNAVPIEDAFITSSNDVRRQRKTTKGFELKAQWKDGAMILRICMGYS